MRNFVIVILISVACALAEEAFEDSSTRIALKLYHDCSKYDGLSVCLKKKAFALLDRLGRMDNLTLSDGITLNRVSAIDKEPEVTEEQLDKILPRAADAQEDAIDNMLVDKFFNFIGSRTVEIALPKVSADDFVGEARKGSGGGGGGGGGGKGGGGKKGGKKGMMGMMMGILGAKMAALMALKTAAAFIIAKKALIIGKIALILSLTMLFRKMMKGGGGGGHDHHDHHVVHSSGWDSGSSSGGYPDSHSGGGWQSGGGGGGWQSGGSGGGWGKRSLTPQEIAYNAYSTKE